MNITYPPRFMHQVDTLIEKNLDNEAFSIEGLSDYLLLSTSQVYRKIKQKTGLSPSVYIRNYRLAIARQLIQDSELRLSEITYKVGFSCPSYFSRSFSERYGHPPSQLRVG